MSENHVVRGRRSLLGLILCILLAAVCDSPTPTSPAPRPQSPSPTPVPEATQYRVSGVVMDAAAGRRIANATVMLRYASGALTTQTDEDGGYPFSFQTNEPVQNEIRRAPADALGLLIARVGTFWGDVRGGHWTTLQILPSGTSEVLQNVRLRPVRTVAAGQPVSLSIEPDSSLSWDPEWDPWTFVSFETLQEEFYVSVQADGVLTIDARTEHGGTVATLTCPYGGCPAWRVQGTMSFPVEARRSPYYVRVEVPRASAPQRYDIQTPLR